MSRTKAATNAAKDTEQIKKPSRIRVILGTVGMMLGGLAPLITGIVGVHGYVTKGYFISKSGGHISGLSGILMSMFFILAGFAMIATAMSISETTAPQDRFLRIVKKLCLEYI